MDGAGTGDCAGTGDGAGTGVGTGTGDCAGDGDGTGVGAEGLSEGLHECITDIVSSSDFLHSEKPKIKNFINK